MFALFFEVYNSWISLSLEVGICSSPKFGVNLCWTDIDHPLDNVFRYSNIWQFRRFQHIPAPTNLEPDWWGEIILKYPSCESVQLENGTLRVVSVSLDRKGYINVIPKSSYSSNEQYIQTDSKYRW